MRRYRNNIRRSMNESARGIGIITESELCDHIVDSIMSMMSAPIGGTMSMSIIDIPDEVMGDIADEEKEMQDYFDDWVADQALMDQDSLEYRNDEYEHGTY